MVLPTRSEVVASFSEAEQKRLHALTWGENLSYYAISAAFLASPLLPISSPVSNEGILHVVLEKAVYVGFGTSIVLDQVQRRIANNRERLSAFIGKASKTALVVGVASPLVIFPESLTKTVAVATAIGLFGGVVNGAPTDGAAGQEAIFKIRDFFPRSLSPRQSFWEGIKVGSWKDNVIKQAGTGVMGLVIIAGKGVSKLFSLAKGKISSRQPDEIVTKSANQDNDVPVKPDSVNAPAKVLGTKSSAVSTPDL